MTDDIDEGVHPNEAIGMFLCPYYQGFGSCRGGCYEEPSCQVDMPRNGWEAYLPADFDKESALAAIKEERERAEYQRWLDAEHRWITRDTLEPMKTQGIYPANPLSYAYEKGTRFFAHHVTTGGSSTRHCKTREEAEQALRDSDAWFRKYFEEKLAWRANGSRTPKGQHALVVNGQHYVPAWMGIRSASDREANQHRGFGGAIFRWRFLDDPEGTVYETNSMYFQTRLTEEQRLELPDNAEWVKKEFEQRKVL